MDGLKIKSAPLKIKEYSSDDMVIKGYASTFGGEPDAYGDVIVSGAFKKTLIKNAGRIKYLFGHDWSRIVGKVVHAEEDEKGLYIEAKIVDTADGVDLMKLVDAGVIDRMSIGYIAQEFEYDNDGICYLKEIDLYEVSAVGLPANDRAHIQKSVLLNDDIKDIRAIVNDIKTIVENIKEEPAKKEEDKKDETLEKASKLLSEILEEK